MKLLLSSEACPEVQQTRFSAIELCNQIKLIWSASPGFDFHVFFIILNSESGFQLVEYQSSTFGLWIYAPLLLYDLIIWTWQVYFFTFCFFLLKWGSSVIYSRCRWFGTALLFLVLYLHQFYFTSFLQEG